MTPQVKTLSLVGVVAVVLTGFGIFAVTQMNSTQEDTSEQPETLQIEDQKESSSGEDKSEQDQEKTGETKLDKKEAIALESEQEDTNIETSVLQSGEQEYKTYTNEFYPRLQITYPTVWDINTYTRNSNAYEVLLERYVVLTQDNEEISFAFLPLTAQGCTPYTQQTPKIDETERFYLTEREEGLVAIRKTTCGTGDFVGTNIDAKIEPNYSVLTNPNNTVLYQAQIRTNLSTTDKNIALLKDIISKSTIE